MTEPTATQEEGRAAETPADAPAVTPDAQPPLSAAEPDFVPGDRLGVPAGTAKRIAEPEVFKPSFMFLAVVSVVTLVSDVGTKMWAEKNLEANFNGVEVVKDHLTLILAKNRGGAWGLLQGTSENVRRPFFLLVSVAAIAFIVTLYSRLQPRQRALKWGLPLVLGGALGNVYDRIRLGHVIDFIDYKAEWIRKMNEMFVKWGWTKEATDHWPTFNVADIAICLGVALMAIDMFTSKRTKPKPVALAGGDPELVTAADVAPLADPAKPVQDAAASVEGPEVPPHDPHAAPEPAKTAETK